MLNTIMNDLATPSTLQSSPSTFRIQVRLQSYRKDVSFQHLHRIAFVTHISLVLPINVLTNVLA